MQLNDKQLKQLEWLSTGYRPFLVIGFAGFMLYLQTLTFDFIFYDDNILIADNYHFLNQFSNIVEAFRQGTWLVLNNQDAYYRPMLTVSFILDARGELSLANYHFSNILYHIIASCLFFAVLLKFNLQRTYALIGALIFIAHPVLAQSIAWVGGRNDVLLSIFILSSFLFFIRYIETPKNANIIFHLLFFAGAMLTKETAAIFPAICFLYLFLFKIKSKKYLLLLLSWFGVFIGWYLLRSTAIETVPAQLAPESILRSAFFHSPALLLYAGKVLMPFNLSVMPVMQMESYLWGVLSLLLIILGIWFCKNRESKLIWLGFLWLLLFLAPSLITAGASAQDNFVIREDRIYLPLMGALIGLSGLLPAGKFIKPPAFVILGAGAIVILFSYLTIGHSKNFKNRLAFWGEAAAQSPDYAFAHLHLGDAYLAQEQYELAIKEYLTTANLNPAELVIHNNLGVLYLRKNLLKEAEQEFLNELKINPGYNSSFFNLGLVYSRQSRLQEAEQMWLKSLELNPYNINVYQNLIMLYIEQNNIIKAKPLIQNLQQKNIPIPQEVLKAAGMQ